MRRYHRAEPRIRTPYKAPHRGAIPRIETLTSTMSLPPRPIVRLLNLALLGAAAFFLALHAVHLTADFPNQSPWMDWSKYTDEGWYGDAAIRHFQLGHWYVPGDFNPAAALPILPSLEALLFAFTGVSLLAARALTVGIFAGILVASWLLLARGAAPRHTNRPTHLLTASAAVLLLAVSPFCFVFTRLAIIEPLLILLTLCALLAASAVRSPNPSASITETLRANLLPALALGLLLPALVLTKTTALFLFPAIAWMLFASTGYRLRDFFRIGLSIGALAAALWLAYFLLLIRPHYLLDYRYLFSANAYTGMTRENWREVLVNTVTAGDWIGRLLYPLALLAVVWSLLSFRRLRAHPLIASLLLWIAGYTAFLAYHNNLQPRYYLVIAVPLTLLLPVVFDALVLPQLTGANPRLRPAALALAAVMAAAITLPDARLTLHFVRHPEYTLLNAARQVRDYIQTAQRTDPTRNPLILSISGSELALMNGLPSICDDFGTLELGDRVKLYHPGWYLAWNQIDDDKMDAMAALYHPVRVATFPAMDDPDRNVLVLYRLDPASQPPTGRHRHKPIPRALQTKLGEQPSTSQLVH